MEKLNVFIVCPVIIFLKARQVSSMIPSSRPTVPPILIAISLENYFDFETWGRTDGRTNDMCENCDYYRRPWPWVGRVDQLSVT